MESEYVQDKPEVRVVKTELEALAIISQNINTLVEQNAEMIKLLVFMFRFFQATDAEEQDKLRLNTVLIEKEKEIPHGSSRTEPAAKEPTEPTAPSRGFPTFKTG